MEQLNTVSAEYSSLCSGNVADYGVGVACFLRVHAGKKNGFEDCDEVVGKNVCMERRGTDGIARLPS